MQIADHRLGEVDAWYNPSLVPPPSSPMLSLGATFFNCNARRYHNTRLNHHCSSNATRSPHKDWRNAQPPQLKITIPGLEKGLFIQCKERLNHHLSNARRSQHQDWRKAHPRRGDHNTRTGERLNHLSSAGRGQLPPVMVYMMCMHVMNCFAPCVHGYKHYIL